MSTMKMTSTTLKKISATDSNTINGTRRNRKWVQHVVTAGIMAMDIPAPIVRQRSMSILTTRSTASGAVRRRTDRRVHSRRRASTATGMGPTSASGAARQAQARPVPLVRAGGTRGRSDCQSGMLRLFVHADSKEFHRWIGFEIPRDDLPKVVSIEIELSEQ